MFKLTTFGLDKSKSLEPHFMILTENQLRVNINRSDSETNPSKSSLTNWINGLNVLENSPMYVGKDFYGRKVTVEVV